MKPLFINKSMDPSSLKNVNGKQLAVYWRANKRVCMTSSMFGDWFCNSFVLDVQRYLEKKNFSLKVLLLGNTPGHLKELEHPNVKIIFLPPNTASLIQPLDQGVISTFKAYYV
ncbi:Tigger transposable element-derived protein 1, partial [Stegodyphus mimosarum]